LETGAFLFMTKKCIICGDVAGLQIKDSSEFYCVECAELQFGDLALLVKVDNDVRKLHKFLEEE